MGLYWNKGRCCLRDLHHRASGRCFCCVLHTIKCFLSHIRRLFLQRNKESGSQSEKSSPSVMTLASDTSNMLRRSSKSARGTSETPCGISRSRSDTCYCIPSTMVVDPMPRRGSDWTASVRRTVTEHSDIHKILRPLQFIHKEEGQSEEKASLLNRRYSGLSSKITPFSICSEVSSTTSKTTKEVSRSQSMKSKKPEGRYRNRGSSIPNEANQTCTGTKVKQRTVSNRSLPLPGDEADYLRLRNFSVTSKGVVNRGDSFRSKMSPRVVKKQSNTEQEEENKREKSDVQNPGTETFRVLLIGATDVGKTALKNQFSTSEYISAYESVHDDEQEAAVTIVLNNEESEISFEERTIHEASAYLQGACPDPDAYVVIYSVANRRSYLQARNMLSQLETKFDSKAVILVANKTDLARLRAVTTEEGKSLAKERGTKFIETSAAINHQVDELLVGILTQIRMKRAKMADKQRKKRESTRRSSNCPGSKASGVLKKILRRACLKSKSCDNLHVL